MHRTSLLIQGCVNLFEVVRYGTLSSITLWHPSLKNDQKSLKPDCHPNPGPRPPKFPCLKCRKAVKNDHASVHCETCEQWGHVECLGITDVRFEVLVDYSFAWICPVCDSQNVTQRSSSDTSDTTLIPTESSRSSEQDVSIQDHSIDLNSS